MSTISIKTNQDIGISQIMTNSLKTAHIRYIVFNQPWIDDVKKHRWEPCVKYAIKKEDAQNYYIYLTSKKLEKIPKSQEGASYRVGETVNYLCTQIEK